MCSHFPHQTVGSLVLVAALLAHSIMLPADFTLQLQKFLSLLLYLGADSINPLLHLSADLVSPLLCLSLLTLPPKDFLSQLLYLSLSWQLLHLHLIALLLVLVDLLLQLGNLLRLAAGRP